jgi:4-hydroxy 2-oxovalerate aldolase
MKHIQILDCTLRDGGYYTNWNYTENVLTAYYKKMNNLPVAYAEIGYRTQRDDQYLGEMFYTPQYMLEKAASLMPNIPVSLMLDEKDTPPEALSALLNPCRGLAQMVRIAAAPHRLQQALALTGPIKAMGFKVALNIMYASRWLNEPTFLQTLSAIDDATIDYFYIVDSFGALYPNQVKALIQAIRQHTRVPLGFHGHNNLELAFANTLVAIENGCTIVDSTIMGMGRGAGNMKTELLLTALAAQQQQEIDFDSLSDLTETFRQLHDKYQWDTNLAYMLAGAHSIPQKEIMDLMGKRRYSVGTIIRRLLPMLPDSKEKNQLVIPPLNERHSKEVFITGGGETVAEHLAAFQRLMQQKQQSNSSYSIIHSSTRFMPVFVGWKGMEQYYCLFGKEGKRLESFDNAAAVMQDHYFIVPGMTALADTYIPAPLQQQVLRTTDCFAPDYEDSPLALAIEAAIELRAETIYLYGFDGYLQQDSGSNIGLFQENQQIIDLAVSKGIRLYSLTPTRYANVKEVSIFRFL